MFYTIRYAKVPDDIVEVNETSEQEDEDKEQSIIYLRP